MNKYLDKGYCLEIGNKVYTIIAHTASGSSCAVYEAECDGSTYIIKECCPVFLDFNRSENGSILVSDDKIKKFDYYKEQFKNSYKREKSVREIPGLMNSTPHVNDINNCNNTLYYSVIKVDGKEFSEVIKEENILECIKAYKSIADLAQKYHAHGYLMLDIKPENILILPETKELPVYVDYDSIMKKEEIEFGNPLSYTHNWAAPEQKNPYSYKKISEKTDVFAVGEMLFFTVFGRHSNDYDHRGFSRYDYDKSRFAMEICNRPKTRKILTEIFHNTIRSVANNRCSMQDLVEKFCILINELEKKQYIISTSIDTINNFIGRESELEAIDSKFNDNKIVFIYGIAGVGKSEIARRYYDNSKYDTKMFCTFNNNLETTICSETGINIVEFYRDENENNFDFAKRKLSKLNELLTENSLLVIDNLDTKIADVNQEIWSMVSSLPCRILIASRNEPNKEYAAISIESMSTDSLAALYNAIYPFNDESKSAVNTIIENLYNNALLLKLIASQAKDKGERPEEMCKDLEDNGITSFSKDCIELNKDSMVTTDTIANYLDKIFGFSNMSDEQILTLAEAAFMPENIEKKVFIAFMDMEDTEPLKYLISLGWISDINYRINVHPLIKKLIISKIKNNNTFEKAMYKKFIFALCVDVDDYNKLLIYYNEIDKFKDTERYDILKILSRAHDKKQFIDILEEIGYKIWENKFSSFWSLKYLIYWISFYYIYGNIDDKINMINYAISEFKDIETEYEFRELAFYYLTKLLYINDPNNKKRCYAISKEHLKSTKSNDYYWKLKWKLNTITYLEKSKIVKKIKLETSISFPIRASFLLIDLSISEYTKALLIGISLFNDILRFALTEKMSNRHTCKFYIKIYLLLNNTFFNRREKNTLPDALNPKIENLTSILKFNYYYFNILYYNRFHKTKEVNRIFDYISKMYEENEIVETVDLYNVFEIIADIAVEENDFENAKLLYNKCMKLNEILNLHKENSLNSKIQEIDEKLNNN